MAYQKVRPMTGTASTAPSIHVLDGTGKNCHVVLGRLQADLPP